MKCNASYKKDNLVVETVKMENDSGDPKRHPEFIFQIADKHDLGLDRELALNIFLKASHNCLARIMCFQNRIYVSTNLTNFIDLVEYITELGFEER